MPQSDLDGLSPEIKEAAQGIMNKLQAIVDTERPRQASRVASVLVEFCAFETALNGRPLDAARFIQIASELDTMSRVSK